VRLVAVPPVTDPTLTVTVGADERLLDLNRRFAMRAADPAVLRASAAVLDTVGNAGGLGAAGCLLASAAADAFSEPADPATRLRALGAGIRAISALDPGVSAAIDDIELRAGSTQSGADAVHAADLCTLFDPELSLVPATEEVHVVLDSDQQLPAALRLIARLSSAPGRRGGTLTLGGRFVATHQKALSRLPVLAGVRLEARIRRRLIDPAWSPGQQVGLGWRGPEDGPPDTDRWAGWLDAATFAEMTAPELERCAGLVVSICGSADPGGPEAGTRSALTALAAKIPVAVEIVAGAPRGDTSPGAWWARRGSLVRVAGFRPYRPPLAAGAAAPPGHDLARWAAPAAAATMAELAGLIARYAPGGGLFPGRVAGALFAVEHRPRIWGEHYWDPAVRLVRTEHAATDHGGAGHFLVSLRSGTLTRVPPALAALLTRIRLGGPSAEQAIGTLPAARRERLLASLAAARAVSEGRAAA
jgi:hypothetical protein